MRFDGDEAAEAGVSVSEELLCVGKGAFYSFLASFIEPFAPVGETVGVRALPGVLPDMAGDGFGVFGAAGAGGKQRAGGADLRGAFVMAIAVAVGGGIIQELALRTAVTV